MAADGYGLFDRIGEYEDSVRTDYLPGPEGIVVSLFEQPRLTWKFVHA